MEAVRWICWTLLALIACAVDGCTSAQLRYSTVNQAETLTEIYEAQVLNNLAMFIEDPYALPHFAVANSGTLSITDFGQLNSPSLNQFRQTIGLEGSRQAAEGWTLDPVRDPHRLTLMRCAYQRAVGVVLERCPDCCDLEKEWHLKPDLLIPAYDRQTNRALPDPDTGRPVVALAPDGQPFIDKDGKLTSSGEAAIDQDGFLHVPQYDCNGPCAITCGWFCHGTLKDVPPHCRHSVGRFHGTYVWVPPEHRDELTRLTLTILDYAVSDRPSPQTKQVVRYLDALGNPATVSDYSQQITLTVPADSATDVARSIPDLDSEIKQLEIERNNLDSFLALVAKVQELALRISATTDKPQLRILSEEKSKQEARVLALRKALALPDDDAQLKELLTKDVNRIAILKRARASVQRNIRHVTMKPIQPTVLNTRMLLDILAPPSPSSPRP
jgi:hypothetical protein